MYFKERVQMSVDYKGTFADFLLLSQSHSKWSIRHIYQVNIYIRQYINWTIYKFVVEANVWNNAFGICFIRFYAVPLMV